jgi:epsilon-lactone hydrolase
MVGIPHMTSLQLALVALVLVAISASAPEALADRNADATVDSAGTVNLPAFSVPLSQYMSEESKARFIYETDHGLDVSSIDKEDPGYMQRVRTAVDNWIRPKIERARRQHAVQIERKVFAGVNAHVVTPVTGVPPDNKSRILINLHGGGFMAGAGLGLAESIPVASKGGFKVVTVDYRLAPEHKFPAASEDVAAVYEELLKKHSASEIGIYGCSAGGTLAAMVIPWFQKQNLPIPGAVGILSAAAFGNFHSPGDKGSWGGDSAYVARPLTGGKPLRANQDYQLPGDSYLSEADLSDPLVSPALWPAVLAKFPPTLLVTGTRAWDMSAAIQTHRELVKAGVNADLHLWDGMGHCFFLEEDLPESQEAYDVVIKFFKRNLKSRV